jgi:hypothetical protein
MTEAPRWRLNSAHYLNVTELPDGTRPEWEHKETARETGRMVRKLFVVPVLLDPKDPSVCNRDGEVVVAHEGEFNNRADIIFQGDPTPEMEPLNDAAQALTDSLRAKWDHPIDSLPANGGMNAEESSFMAKMMEAFSRGAPANTSVPSEEVEALKARLASLEAALAAKAAPPSERRA